MACRSGYEVHDLHSEPLYRVQIGDTAFSGGVDGGVVPYSVLAESAALLLRVGFVHKQSTADTAAFRRNNPHLRQVQEKLSPLLCSLSGSVCLDNLHSHALESMYAG